MSDKCSVSSWLQYYRDLKVRMHAAASGRMTFNDVDVIKAKTYTFASLAAALSVSAVFKPEHMQTIDDASEIFTKLESSSAGVNAVRAVVAPYTESVLFPMFDAVLSAVPREDFVNK